MVLSILVAGDKPNLFLKDKLNPRGLNGPRGRFLRSLNTSFRVQVRESWFNLIICNVYLASYKWTLVWLELAQQ